MKYIREAKDQYHKNKYKGTPPPTQFEPKFLATGEFDPRNFL